MINYSYAKCVKNVPGVTEIPNECFLCYNNLSTYHSLFFKCVGVCSMLSKSLCYLKLIYNRLYMCPKILQS